MTTNYDKYLKYKKKYLDLQNDNNQYGSGDGAGVDPDHLYIFPTLKDAIDFSIIPPEGFEVNWNNRPLFAKTRDSEDFNKNKFKSCETKDNFDEWNIPSIGEDTDLYSSITNCSHFKTFPDKDELFIVTDSYTVVWKNKKDMKKFEHVQFFITPNSILKITKNKIYRKKNKNSTALYVKVELIREMSMLKTMIKPLSDNKVDYNIGSEGFLKIKTTDLSSKSSQLKTSILSTLDSFLKGMVGALIMHMVEAGVGLLTAGVGAALLQQAVNHIISSIASLGGVDNDVIECVEKISELYFDNLKQNIMNKIRYQDEHILFENKINILNIINHINQKKMNPIKYINLKSEDNNKMKQDIIINIINTLKTINHPLGEK
tara:strand:+ start:6311 stop:7432 length:1122 start_codon:yes stop_codon:yes gene_type:complete